MTEFAEADARLAGMHGYERARRQEILCACGQWHPRTGVTLGGVEVIACPEAPDHGIFGGLSLPGPVQIREVPDA